MTESGAETFSGEPVPFNQLLSRTAQETNDALDVLLPMPDGKERRVLEAMRYAALDGGKRLRPFLVMATADLFGEPRSRSVRAAAAVEMVHCYSLIHDDLPAMDDDDLRRGRPTCHKAYDEATAILAGDGLLTQAFTVLSDPATHADAGIRVELVAALAQAAGAYGMVGGQMLDLIAESETLTEAEVTHLQSLKTGCLLAVACQLGGLLGQAGQDVSENLRKFGLTLGAAFQIADDLLDLEASTDDLGKAAGKDHAAGKATFISLYGPERARQKSKSLVDQAVTLLDGFGPEANPLREAAKFTVTRHV